MTSAQRSVRFATTSDGLRIAYMFAGDEAASPLVLVPGWISHLDFEWRQPSVALNQLLGQHWHLVFYDGRGTGLSDRQADDLSLEARLKDLEAVVDHAGLDRFNVFAWSMGAPVAMAYAARHPGRIEKLVLYASFARGPDEREASGPHSQAVIKALVDLIRAEWGVGARTTMGFIHPDADRQEMEESMAFFRAASSGDVAARILEEAFLNTDVRAYLPQITVPALVIHRKEDNAVQLESGREVATLLPNARFVVLEGDHHPPFHGDTESIVRAIDSFFGLEPMARPTAPASAAHVHDHDHDHTHAGAPVTILFTDMEGSTSLTQRLGDASAQELVRAHNTVVRDALHAHGGDEIKHTGDGIMASFPSASRALECAIAIQRALALHNQDHPDASINLRIGLNMGEPVREQDDLFGQAVQLARRICDRATPGQILTSNVVRELVAGKGFLFSDQGATAPW